MAPEPVTDPQEWITMREAAQRIGMSSSWIRKHGPAAGVDIRGGGRGTQMVDWAAIEAWIKRSKIGPPK